MAEIREGWRCGCCQTMHSPDTAQCMFCSEIMREFIKLANPEEYSRIIEPFHSCPAPQTMTPTARLLTEAAAAFLKKTDKK